METVYDRILGTLVGVAIGDAMGMPGEMWSRKHIQAHFGSIEEFLPGADENVISCGLSAGEVTDDTIVTMLVAEAVIEAKGEIDPLNIIHKIDGWAKANFKSKAVIGPSTRRAFEQIANGIPISEAGRYGETNGAAMRISPIGIISDYLHMTDLVDNVALACMPAHNTSVAISAASAVAAAVSYAVDGGKDFDEMVAVSKLGAKLGAERGYDVCSASVSERIDLAISVVREQKCPEETLSRLYSLVGTSISSVESVPAAIALAYYSRGDTMRCAGYCANIGGDTDTIGAMACGICGAMAGINAIPREIFALLSSVNKIPFEDVAKKLEKLRKRQG